MRLVTNLNTLGRQEACMRLVTNLITRREEACMRLVTNLPQEAGRHVCASSPTNLREAGGLYAPHLS